MLSYYQFRFSCLVLGLVCLGVQLLFSCALVRQ
jgi:hypothetical protein